MYPCKSQSFLEKGESGILYITYMTGELAGKKFKDRSEQRDSTAPHYLA